MANDRITNINEWKEGENRKALRITEALCVLMTLAIVCELSFPLIRAWASVKNLSDLDHRFVNSVIFVQSPGKPMATTRLLVILFKLRVRTEQKKNQPTSRIFDPIKNLFWIKKKKKRNAILSAYCLCPRDEMRSPAYTHMASRCIFWYTDRKTIIIIVQRLLQNDQNCLEHFQAISIKPAIRQSDLWSHLSAFAVSLPLFSILHSNSFVLSLGIVFFPRAVFFSSISNGLAVCSLLWARTRMRTIETLWRIRMAIYKWFFFPLLYGNWSFSGRRWTDMAPVQ